MTDMDLGNGVAPSLADVVAETVRLASATPEPPARVRVQCGEVTVEVEWPERTGGPASALTADALESGAAEAEPDGLDFIRAPLVGTFYWAPKPGERQFVNIGDTVVIGQEVGILESMKLMNPIEAQCAGEVVEILVPDGSPVDYDQRLISLRPDSG